MQTIPIVRLRYLKEQTRSWMDIIGTARTQLKSALSRLAKMVSTCLQFNMAGSASPVPQHKKRSINMARVVIAEVTEKEVLGQTMFTPSKVRRSDLYIYVIWIRHFEFRHCHIDCFFSSRSDQSYIAFV